MRKPPSAPHHPRRRGLFRSFVAAFSGLGRVLFLEPNARIHAAAALTVVGAGLLLEIDAGAWTVVTLIIGLVFALEGLNSAVEAAVDLASPEWNRAAARAKDTAAAAVLIAALASLVVAATIFLPRIDGLGAALAQAWSTRPLLVALWGLATLSLLASGLLMRRH